MIVKIPHLNQTAHHFHTMGLVRAFVLWMKDTNVMVRVFLISMSG